MAKLYKVRKKCMICGNVFYPRYAGSLYCEDCKNRKKEEAKPVKKVVPKAKPVKKVAPKPAVQKKKQAAKKPSKKTVQSTKKKATVKKSKK